MGMPDRAYYRLREEQSGRAALAAADPRAAAAHRELARRYAELAEAGMERRRSVSALFGVQPMQAHA